MYLQQSFWRRQQLSVRRDVASGSSSVAQQAAGCSDERVPKVESFVSSSFVAVPGARPALCLLVLLYVMGCLAVPFLHHGVLCLRCVAVLWALFLCGKCMRGGLGSSASRTMTKADSMTRVVSASSEPVALCAQVYLP